MKVPTQEGPSVSTQGEVAPGVQPFQFHENNAVGNAISAAGREAGQGIGEAVGEAAGAYQKAQQQANHIAVTDRLGAFQAQADGLIQGNADTRGTGDFGNGFLDLEGERALASSKGVRDQIDKYREQQAATITNPQARAQFLAESWHLTNAYHKQIEDHVRKQVKVMDVQGVGALIQSSLRDAEGGQVSLELLAAQREATAARMAASENFGPAKAEAFVQDHALKTVQGLVLNGGLEGIAKAQDIITNHGDILGTKRDEAKAYLATALRSLQRGNADDKTFGVVADVLKQSPMLVKGGEQPFVLLDKQAGPTTFVDEEAARQNFRLFIERGLANKTLVGPEVKPLTAEFERQLKDAQKLKQAFVNDLRNQAAQARYNNQQVPAGVADALTQLGDAERLDKAKNAAEARLRSIESNLRARWKFQGSNLVHEYYASAPQGERIQRKPYEFAEEMKAKGIEVSPEATAALAAAMQRDKERAQKDQGASEHRAISALSKELGHDLTSVWKDKRAAEAAAGKSLTPRASLDLQVATARANGVAILTRWEQDFTAEQGRAPTDEERQKRAATIAQEVRFNAPQPPPTTYTPRSQLAAPSNAASQQPAPKKRTFTIQNGRLVPKE